VSLGDSGQDLGGSANAGEGSSSSKWMRLGSLGSVRTGVGCSNHVLIAGWTAASNERWVLRRCGVLGVLGICVILQYPVLSAPGSIAIVYASKV